MSKKMAEVIQKASELAGHAPESLQAAAFQKAFDALMAEDAGNGGKPRGRKGTGKKGGSKSEKADQDVLPMDSMNRTAHPEINSKGSVLGNSLRLLRAAKDDLGIDGLTGSEIARVLADKFRVKTAQQTVSRILNEAGEYVDRRKEGIKVLFRIMEPGEEYLDSDHVEQAAPENGQPKRGARRKGRRKKASKKKSNDRRARRQTSTTGDPPKNTGKRTTTGPATFLVQLIDGGFFDSPKTIAAITKHLKDNHGRTFKANELSPALLRLLRSESLSRGKNSDGQYEYKKT